MKETLIGRAEEIASLQTCFQSGRNEFVVVYGRRRIGKTFLVRQHFKNKFAFSYVGAHNFSRREQLENFTSALREYSKQPVSVSPRNWIEAFECLKTLILNMPSKQRKVLFFDEMPWIDKSDSSFVKALENFWNGWVAARNDIMLVACGSATSWMINKIVKNTGGLHNRITRHIYLRPFTLKETEEYLESRGLHWDRYSIIQSYMATGGIPFYLSLLDTSEQNANRNINNLFFAPNAPLRFEFDELFNTLFPNSENYISVVRALAKQPYGMTLKEISKVTKLSGGWLTRIINNLMQCDFINYTAKYGNKSKEKIFRLCDMYTLFYFKFIENNYGKDSDFWVHSLMSPSLIVWQGQCFELVVFQHLQLVKKALGVDKILNSTTSWRSKVESPNEKRTQIDMVIERADRVINLCEVKFTNSPFIIDKDYEMLLRTRMEIFRSETKSRKTLVTTMITTYGVIPGKHSSIAQAQVTMDDLFE